MNYKTLYISKAFCEVGWLENTTFGEHQASAACHAFYKRTILFM